MKVVFNVDDLKICLGRWKPFSKMHSGIRATIADSVHIDENGKEMPMRKLAIFLSAGGKNAQGYDVPARPFFQDYMNENKDWLIEQVIKNLEFHKRRTVEHGPRSHLSSIYVVLHTHTLAPAVRQHFQQWVRSGLYYKANVPNAEYTISKKGSDTPLVDSGQLANSIIAYPVTGQGIN